MLGVPKSTHPTTFCWKMEIVCMMYWGHAQMLHWHVVVCNTVGNRPNTSEENIQVQSLQKFVSHKKIVCKSLLVLPSCLPCSPFLIAQMLIYDFHSAHSVVGKLLSCFFASTSMYLTKVSFLPLFGNYIADVWLLQLGATLIIFTLRSRFLAKFILHVYSKTFVCTLPSWEICWCSLSCSWSSKAPMDCSPPVMAPTSYLSCILSSSPGTKR
jgi:hypothetical protein